MQITGLKSDLYLFIPEWASLYNCKGRVCKLQNKLYSIKKPNNFYKRNMKPKMNIELYASFICIFSTV